MERLDFSTVMGVLRRHVNEDLCPNQTELVDMLLLRLEDQGWQDTLDYANVCGSLAYYLMMMGKLDTGFSHYKNCLDVYKKIYGDDSDIVAAKKEQIQQNCAKLGFSLAKRLPGEI